MHLVQEPTSAVQYEAVDGLAADAAATGVPSNSGFIPPPVICAEQAEVSVQVCPSEVPRCRFFGGKPAFNFIPPCRSTVVAATKVDSSIQMSSDAAPNGFVVYPSPACDAVGNTGKDDRCWAVCTAQAASATVGNGGAALTCRPGFLAEAAAATDLHAAPTSTAKRGVRAPAARCTSAARGHVLAARGARPTSYVGRSRECQAGWRRERQELRSRQRHLGPAPASGGRGDCMRRPSTAPASLEVRGVALSLHARPTT